MKATLTEKEKNYLNNIIKPFKERVRYVTRCGWRGCNQEFIRIWLYDDYGDDIMLPWFEKDEYYKGMEVGYDYNLEELGLI